MVEIERTFRNQVRKLYRAEAVLADELRDMTARAKDPAVKRVLGDYALRTTQHVERLDRLVRELKTSHCARMQSELTSLISTARRAKKLGGDARLIAATSRVESRKVEWYEAARELASRLMLDVAWEVMDTHLDEERECEEALASLATVPARVRSA